jgi:hypothetical protein
MTDWSALRHAYGSASDVPGLLAQLAPDPKSNVWHDLWSCLCHQGTVYSASFAALPILLETAKGWKPQERTMVIILAASIISSQESGPRELDPQGLGELVKPEFLQLCMESLTYAELPDVEFIYLLQSQLALEGDRIWGRKLDHLADGEFPGECPRCHSELYLVIGKDGFFASTGDWIRNANIPRTEIKANEGTLPPIGERLRAYADAASKHELARWFRYLFGTGTCPSCESTFAVSDAIARS